MMNKIKVGFLPLYIKLYDDCGLTIRERLEPFYEKMARDLEGRGFDVIRSAFCCVKSEFEATVAKFERAGADVILTWHAAYSPSLESIDTLAKIKLPIIVIDTTETFDFSPSQDSGEINICHGIHGVMDMTSMLRRRGKPYAIAAGHYPTSDVMDRAVRLIRVAKAASGLSGTRVGTIGGSFDGMGDFLISDDDMKKYFGVEVVYSDGDELNEIKKTVTKDEIDREIASDNETFEVLAPFSRESHEKTVRNCLAVRKWLEKHDISAFTVNFREICPEMGLEIMPFMEACKAMARGCGYAGEGDVLTAAVTGALIRGFDTASFVEIFCPDWKGGRLMLSHMGEFNLALAGDKPEIKEIPFIFGHADNPVVCYGCYRSGEAVFANVFFDGQKYNMVLAPVTMEEVHDHTNFRGTVRGWMKPHMPLGSFLEAISTAGVTHHSSLVYGADMSELEYFASLLGLNVIKIH